MTRFIGRERGVRRIADLVARERLWMEADAPTEEALSVLAPYPADLMEAFAVSTAVNRAGRDAPEMVAPLAD